MENIKISADKNKVLTLTLLIFLCSLLAKQIITAYQEEQNYAESKNAVANKEHQYHSYGNPEQNKAN